jgi:hypothetical protein
MARQSGNRLIAPTNDERRHCTRHYFATARRKSAALQQITFTQLFDDLRQSSKV